MSYEGRKQKKTFIIKSNVIYYMLLHAVFRGFKVKANKIPKKNFITQPISHMNIMFYVH